MSSHSHICTKTDCFFCYITKQPIKKGIPYFPDPYQSEVDKVGGYYSWRDAILLENSKVPLPRIQERLNARIRKRHVLRENRFFSQSDNEYIIKNYSQNDAKTIAKVLNKSIQSIYGRINYFRKFNIIPLKKNYGK